MKPPFREVERPKPQEALIAALLLVGLLVAVLVSSWLSAGTPPPCPSEDSAGPCVWDAPNRGNGLGRSFVIDSDQHIHYTDSNDRSQGGTP